MLEKIRDLSGDCAVLGGTGAIGSLGTCAISAGLSCISSISEVANHVGSIAFHALLVCAGVALLGAAGLFFTDVVS